MAEGILVAVAPIRTQNVAFHLAQAKLHEDGLGQSVELHLSYDSSKRLSDVAHLIFGGRILAVYWSASRPDIRLSGMGGAG